MIDRIYNYEIASKHIDFTQRASLPAMVDLLLTTAGADATSLGFGLGKLNKDNCSWVLTRLVVELYRSPKVGESIDIRTWVSDTSRALSNRNFIITDQNGDTIGEALSQWCMIDLERRSLVSLKGLGIESQGSPLAIDRSRKIDISSTNEVSTHIAKYSDIDINRHVNTLRYIDMILDELPLSLIERESPLRFDIAFLSESLYGQKLSICYEQSEDCSIFAINREDDTISVKAVFDWL